MQGKDVTFTFGIFLYTFTVIGQAGFVYFLLSVIIAIGILIASQYLSTQLKKNEFWRSLSSNERFIIIDVFTILILILISVIGLHEISPNPDLPEGLRLAGLRIVTRALGVGIFFWVGTKVSDQLKLKKIADRQLIIYLMVFPTELVVILIVQKTFIQWILQGLWLELGYGFTGELLFLGILFLLLLWSRYRLNKREKQILARVREF